MPRLTIDPARTGAALHTAGCVTPALVIDLDQVERNIAAMIRHVGDPSRWRPHVKTIKQSRIVSMLLDAGVQHFKCATVPELRMVLDTARAHGSPVDALLAYPLPAPRLGEVAALAAHHATARVGVTADDPEHLAAILAAGSLEVWLDVDVGMHRTGSAAGHWQDWLDAGRHTAIVGIQAYEGHLGFSEPAGALYDDVAALARRVTGLRWLLTSGSLAFDQALATAALRPDPNRDERWVHQIGAGTLVLGDVASAAPGALIGAAPSTFVAARVVARPTPGRITLDAGNKAIAPDRAPPNCAVLGRPRWRPQRPSEEHLPVLVEDGTTVARDELVLLVPDHVCTTVNLHREVVYLRGGLPCGTGTIDAGGREPPRLAGRP